MSAQVVSKNSSEVVLKSKVGYFTGMEGIAVICAPIVSNLFSFLAVALPLSYTPDWSDGSSILMGLAVGTALPILGGKYWNAYQVTSDLYEYTGTVERYGKKTHYLAAKTFANSLLPFGQKIKTGSKVVLSSDEPSDLVGGSSSRNRYSSYYESAESYKADTYVKFTLLGSEIRQVITPTPVTVWDEAFKSTVSVHEFEETKKLASSRR